MGNYKGLRTLWQPPAETLEAIAGVLGERWRAAATQSARLLWSTPISWVAVRAARANARRAPVHHHFTSGGRLIK
ncbi:MAG TPA: hypothetical protein VH111_12375 [Steroidobacteraceae bacterium]|nr:hypothetical protein [Steroidobacteraceae bacterium]